MTNRKLLHRSLHDLSSIAASSLHLSIQEEEFLHNLDSDHLAHHELTSEEHHDEIIIFLKEFVKTHPDVSHHFFVKLKNICEYVLAGYGMEHIHPEKQEKHKSDAEILKKQIEYIHLKLKKDFLDDILDNSLTSQEEKVEIKKNHPELLSKDSEITSMRSRNIRREYQGEKIDYVAHHQGVSEKSEDNINVLNNYNKLVDFFTNNKDPSLSLQKWLQVNSAYKYKKRLLSAFIKGLRGQYTQQKELFLNLENDPLESLYIKRSTLRNIAQEKPEYFFDIYEEVDNKNEFIVFIRQINLDKTDLTNLYFQARKNNLELKKDLLEQLITQTRNKDDLVSINYQIGILKQKNQEINTDEIHLLASALERKFGGEIVNKLLLNYDESKIAA